MSGTPCSMGLLLPVTPETAVLLAIQHSAGLGSLVAPESSEENQWSCLLRTSPRARRTSS